MSEFGIVSLVVAGVSLWLALRLYRFVRGLASDAKPGGPACGVGCPSCSKEAPGCSAPARMLAELEKVRVK